MINYVPGALNKVLIRPTIPADLAFVLAAETAPENKPFIFQWPAEKHLASFSDPDTAHLLVETTGGDRRPVGYAIVKGLQNPHHSLELMRFVITEKGRGFGKAALAEIKILAFEKCQAHRFWLDVVDHNLRAQGLYTAAGFQREGILREAYFMDSQPLTVIIMSILAQEFFGKDGVTGQAE